LRLPQPDQQRAVLPRLLPRPPRLAGPHGERRDEGRRRAGDRRVRRPCRAERGVHHPERLQQAGGAGGRGRGGASRPRDRRRPAASPPGSLIGPLETAPSWSVVIPAYHEADRLPRYLAEVVAYFIERGEPWEVIVVDDGSTDNTSGVVRAMRDRHPEVRLVRHERNSGKGFAVQAGMAVARGAQRLFADADGATPIAELKRLEAALAAGADVAIGSRAPAGSSTWRRHGWASTRCMTRSAASRRSRGPPPPTSFLGCRPRDSASTSSCCCGPGRRGGASPRCR